jgi:signal transduction histidine kinase
MHFFKLLKILIVGVLCLCIGQSCTMKKSIAPPKQSSTIIDANFTSQSINKQVLISTNLQKKDLNRKDLQNWIKKNAITVNQKSESILVGPYKNYPEVWFYTKIINTDSLSYDLVVDEFNNRRCDGIEVYTIKNGFAKNWGKINRSTSLSEHQMPYMTHAILVSIQAKDTLQLLIKSERAYGFHEVNLRVSSIKDYLKEANYIFLTRMAEVLIFIICFLIVLVLGWVFRYKTMLYLSIFLVFWLLGHVSHWGYLNSVFNFEGVGLTGGSLIAFSSFVGNALYHPFAIELMKPVPKKEKLFSFISYFLMGINLLVASLFLLPISIFHEIDMLIPLWMSISLLVNHIWAMYSSILAIFKAKIYYIFIAFSVAFLPFLLTQFIGIVFVKNPIDVLTLSRPMFLAAIISISLLSIFLLRNKLVTRKLYFKNIAQIKESMESIRKGEIETIGRNLHDNVGNTLASALGYLNLKTINIDVVQKLIIDSINNIRFLSHNLVKDEDMPLNAKLESLVSRFNDFSDINFQYSDFSKAKLNSLEAQNQQNIYMIVQEIMTNIIKHSKATEAYIQVFKNEKNISINIEDDGIGITNVHENTGIGLRNIQKRIELSNLKITTDSTTKGTNYIIEIPDEN